MSPQRTAEPRAVMPIGAEGKALPDELLSDPDDLELPLLTQDS